MKIHHIAVWTMDIERMKSFYMLYFDCTAGANYTNPGKSFESCFLSFNDETRIELMSMLSIKSSNLDTDNQYFGFSHIAFSAGSKDAVDSLTGRLSSDGFQVLSQARLTGDGYYESIVLDPEGNRIEITI
jgi:lactoylglutathione lyase